MQRRCKKFKNLLRPHSAGFLNKDCLNQHSEQLLLFPDLLSEIDVPLSHCFKMHSFRYVGLFALKSGMASLVGERDSLDGGAALEMFDSSGADG